MKILAGNWKMFKTREEIEKFFQEINLTIVSSEVRKIICVSHSHLEAALAMATGSGVEIFAQNCATEAWGAFTGEVSALQLKDLGIHGTLVGHSERRQYFGDDDESCLKRATSALKAGLEVIYCVGERLEERKSGSTLAVLERQTQGVVALVRDFPAKVTVAYEPVWAIGTGLVAEAAQIAEAHAFLASRFSQSPEKVGLLYGGSVKVTNFKEIGQIPHVDGGLVGGASLEASSYVALHNCLL